jgi:orotate phosphoribosyltransferase
MEERTKQEVIAIIRDAGLIMAPPGETFTLASGVQTDFYIDCRKVTLTPKGIDIVVEAIMSMLRDVDFDVIGGLTLGADPIVAGLLMKMGPEARQRGFIVRKEYKTHGLHNMVEGHLGKGDRVVIVEDVVLSGGSVFKAISAAEERDAKVVKVISIIDRLGGASEEFERRGYTLESLVTIRDLGLEE